MADTVILYVDGSKNEKVTRIWLVILNLGYVLICISLMFPIFRNSLFMSSEELDLATDSIVCSQVSVKSSNKSSYQMPFLLHSAR